MNNNFIKRLPWKKVLMSFYWLIALLIIVDQASKATFLYLEATKGPHFQVAVINNFFYFTYHRNTGAAWSILRDSPWLLTLISIAAASIMLSYRIIKRKELPPLYKAAWAVVIAGTLGNFIDRAFYKLITGVPGVVDFLHFQFGSYHFPVFNVADMCLVVGLFSLIILSFIDENKAKNNDKIAKTEVTKDE